MDERKIKRLLIFLGMAIALILIAKSLMIKAATNVGNAAAEKKRAAAVQQAPASVPEAAEPVDMQSASEAAPADRAASDAEATDQ